MASRAPPLLRTEGKAETTSLQEGEGSTQGAQQPEENLVDRKTMLASKTQKLWGFFSLF